MIGLSYPEKDRFLEKKQTQHHKFKTRNLSSIRPGLRKQTKFKLESSRNLLNVDNEIIQYYVFNYSEKQTEYSAEQGLAGDASSGLTASPRAAAVVVIIFYRATVICRPWATGAVAISFLFSRATAIISFWSSRAPVSFPRTIICFVLMRSSLLIFGRRAISHPRTAFFGSRAPGPPLGVGWAI